MECWNIEYFKKIIKKEELQKITLFYKMSQNQLLYNKQNKQNKISASNNYPY